MLQFELLIRFIINKCIVFIVVAQRRLLLLNRKIANRSCSEIKTHIYEVLLQYCSICQILQRRCRPRKANWFIFHTINKQVWFSLTQCTHRLLHTTSNVETVQFEKYTLLLTFTQLQYNQPPIHPFKFSVLRVSLDSMRLKRLKSTKKNLGCDLSFHLSRRRGCRIDAYLFFRSAHAMRTSLICFWDLNEGEQVGSHFQKTWSFRGRTCAIHSSAHTRARTHTADDFPSLFLMYPTDGWRVSECV